MPGAIAAARRVDFLEHLPGYRHESFLPQTLSPRHIHANRRAMVGWQWDNILYSDNLRVRRHQGLQYLFDYIGSVWRCQARIHHGIYVGNGRYYRPQALHAKWHISPVHHACVYGHLHGPMERNGQQERIRRGDRIGLRLRCRLVHRSLHRAVPIQHRDLPDSDP